MRRAKKSENIGCRVSNLVLNPICAADRAGQVSFTLSLMDALSNLHQRLRVAASLLDEAASQIRDVPLSPTKQNIYSIGQALASIYEIQSAIYKLRPELETKYEEPSGDVSAANRRLGELLIAAYDLADASRLPEALALLSAFAENEPSEYHRSLAKTEIERMAKNYET